MDLFSPDNIRRWAYTRELDDAFDQLIEDDDIGDLFDYEMHKACSLELVLEFARDHSCLKRDYFLHELASRLAELYVWPFFTLSPFKNSHRMGMLDKTEYMERVTRFAEARYRDCQVLDRMLDSGDDLIEYIRNTLYLFPRVDPLATIQLGYCEEKRTSLYDAYTHAYNEKRRDLHTALSRLIDKLTPKSR